MKYRFILIGMFVATSILGCSGNREAEYIRHYQSLMEEPPEAESEQLFDISGKAQDISDPAALQYFQELYGLSSLENQTLYWDGETLQLSYYFSQDVPFYQIDTARSYVINRLVLGSINKASPTPYEHWMTDGGVVRDIPYVSCRVYLGKDLMLQDNYEDKQLRGFYENKEAVFAAREYLPDNEAEISELANRYMKDPELIFQKGICDDTRIVHLKADKILAPRKMEQLLTDLSEVEFGGMNCYLVFWAGGEAYYCNFLY